MKMYSTRPTIDIGAIPPGYKIYLPSFSQLSNYYDNYFFP